LINLSSKIIPVFLNSVTLRVNLLSLISKCHCVQVSARTRVMCVVAHLLIRVAYASTASHTAVKNRSSAPSVTSDSSSRRSWESISGYTQV